MKTQLALAGLALLGMWPSATAVNAQQTETDRLSPQEASAAEEIVDRKLEARDLAKENKTLRLGLSIGVRYITDVNDVNFRNAAISPIDSTLSIDGRDPADVVLSGTVTVFPWDKLADTSRAADGTILGVKTRCSWCWLGFTANINLASFTSDNVSTFNKSIEGGIGVSVRLAKDFALAGTYERVFSRRLRGFVSEGEKLVVDGKTLTEVAEDDNRFFVDDNLSAVSFKFVYLF